MNRNPGYVLDGTSCKLGKENVCIGGTCMQVGCDGKVNSNKKRDDCWECGGNNSLCKKFSKRFYPRGSGYVTVASIPAGSVGIKVAQVGSYPSDGISLALYDVSNKVYIIDGVKVRSRVQLAQWREYPMVVEYSGSNDRTKESLQIIGKVPIDLQLKVFKTSSSASRYGILDVNYFQPVIQQSFYKWTYSGKQTLKIQRPCFCGHYSFKGGCGCEMSEISKRFKIEII